MNEYVGVFYVYVWACRWVVYVYKHVGVSYICMSEWVCTLFV